MNTYWAPSTISFGPYGYISYLLDKKINVGIVKLYASMGFQNALRKKVLTDQYKK